MSRPTKIAVLEALKALGVEGDPNANYNDLFAQLTALGGKVEPEEAEEVVPEKLEPMPSQEPLPELVQEPVQEERLTPHNTSSAVTAVSAAKEDYLRRYQYRKQTVPGSVDSDPPKGSKAETMKASLLSQEKVRIIIPRVGGEDPTVKLSVTLNGYRLDLPKQAYVELPQQIAEIIMDSLNQTDAAILRGQISGSRSKENALL